MNKPTISLITYDRLPNLDPDDVLLKEALERRGCLVKIAIWDDPRVDWKSAGTCVVRSTWDYHLKYQKFCSWIREVAKVTNVLNSPTQLLWNSRKTYLQHLSKKGLPVIPTYFITESVRPSLAEIMYQFGWNEAIVKPSIGLATSGVQRIKNSMGNLLDGEQHITELLKNSEVMVQEYLPSVHDYGERALMFINGKYSHCVRKSAFQILAVAGAAGETIAEATQEEIAIAASIVNSMDETPLYARVDLVRDRYNRPLLMELELVEPSLFITTKPASAETFADAIMRRLSTSQQFVPSRQVQISQTHSV